MIPEAFDPSVEKDDAHYIGMSLFFLGLPFVLYMAIHLFIG